MNLSSEEKEFQAEVTAYTVASYFNIDTSDYSLGYLANWTQGKELQDKAKLLEEVRTALIEFIEIMEPELMKVQKKSLEIGKDLFLQAVQDRTDTSELVEDRKSTRLNSSHVSISYAVFCLKKKIIQNRYMHNRTIIWRCVY